jgi:hypothetical protein
MAKLAERAYFHGTFLKEAVEALDAGNPLAPSRPKGVSRFARSREGLVYLTPSFNQAAEYAFMRGRADWGPVGRDRYSDVARVFEFGSSDADVVPEEDELGYAVKVALCREAGLETHWSMNSGFAEALRADGALLVELAAFARSALTDLKGQRRLQTFGNWKGADVTAVGKRLSTMLPSEIEQAIVDAGVSVATSGSMHPVAAYRLPSRVMSPEQAELAWRTQPASAERVAFSSRGL